MNVPSLNSGRNDVPKVAPSQTVQAVMAAAPVIRSPLLLIANPTAGW